MILDLGSAPCRLNDIALGESDLVIIPTADEQQETEAAIEALAHLRRLERGQSSQEIPVKVLFARTKPDRDKSMLEKPLNSELRERVDCFDAELPAQSAFSALHSYGDRLMALDRKEVPDSIRAAAKAQIFVEEVQQILKRMPMPANGIVH